MVGLVLLGGRNQKDDVGGKIKNRLWSKWALRSQVEYSSGSRNVIGVSGHGSGVPFRTFSRRRYSRENVAHR